METDGNIHFFRLLVVSVRNHPARLTELLLKLCISIQSSCDPSSSLRLVLLSAMNSVICTGSCACKNAEVRQIKPTTVRTTKDFMELASDYEVKRVQRSRQGSSYKSIFGDLFLFYFSAQGGQTPIARIEL